MPIQAIRAAPPSQLLSFGAEKHAHVVEALVYFILGVIGDVLRGAEGALLAGSLNTAYRGNDNFHTYY